MSIVNKKELHPIFNQKPFILARPGIGQLYKTD